MRFLVLPTLLLAEIILFTAISGVAFDSWQGWRDYFFTYFRDLLAHSAPILVLAFGMTLILMTAGIDLSVASMAALISAIMGSFPGGPDFWWTAVPVGLTAGFLLGAVNGGVIAGLDVPPIIATLGTMILYRGLSFVVLGDMERAPFIEVPGYEWFGQLPGAGVVLGLLFIAGGTYFYFSRWRREILMIGGNRVAARYAGIGVRWRLWQVYSLMGVLAFVAAWLFTARNSSISASSMTGLELHVIVAVVLGGTRVQGGMGSLAGTFFGVLLMAVLDEGLRGAAIWGDKNLPFKISHLEYILLGGLLILGVWLNTRFGGQQKKAAGV